MTEPATATPEVKGLVVLPFDDVAKAETFASLVIAQMPDSPAPFVLHGTAYEWRTPEGQAGQIIEIFEGSQFEVFQGDGGPLHTVLQRITQEAPDAGTEGSTDHHAGRAGAGEGR